MGLDLKVIASHFRERRGELLSTAMLRFDRDAVLFSQLTPDATPCLVHPLPAGLSVGCYEDAGLTYERVDRTGEPLTYTTPAEVLRLRVPDDLAAWNKAILAFLTTLPPESLIVLYWC